ESATVEDLLRLWTELDGPALLKALKRRTWKYSQTTYGRKWHGQRRPEKGNLRDQELDQALTRLWIRVKKNPVFWGDYRVLLAGDPRNAILDLIAEIRVRDEKDY